MKSNVTESLRNKILAATVIQYAAIPNPCAAAAALVAEGRYPAAQLMIHLPDGVCNLRAFLEVRGIDHQAAALMTKHADSYKLILAAQDMDTNPYSY